MQIWCGRGCECELDWAHKSMFCNVTQIIVGKKRAVFIFNIQELVYAIDELFYAWMFECVCVYECGCALVRVRVCVPTCVAFSIPLNQWLSRDFDDKYCVFSETELSFSQRARFIDRIGTSATYFPVIQSIPSSISTLHASTGLCSYESIQCPFTPAEYTAHRSDTRPESRKCRE